MTIEKAIEYNKNLRMYMKISDKTQPCKFLEGNYVALDMAIKSLEVWEKVREEIVNMKDNPLFGMVSKETLHEIALEIIDKHLSEVNK